MLAYEAAGVPIDRIAETLGLTSADVLTLLAPFRFLIVDRVHAAFASESFRKHAQRHLDTETRHLLDLRIDKLMTAPSGHGPLEELPALLRDTHRYADLCDLLSPDFYQRGIEKNNSLLTLKRSNAIGISAAESAQRESVLFQFCLNSSIFNELSMAELWRAEVHARMSVGDFTNALKVANSSPIKEDRLCLLALTAKLERNRSGIVNDDLLASIRQAFLSTELDYTSPQSVQLASDLIAVLPDVAADITSKLQSGRKGIDADVALASILMQADYIEDPEASDKLNRVEELRAQIVSPQVRLLSEVAPRLLGEGTSVDEVIREAERIKSISLRLPLLEAWLRRHRRSPNALQVTEYAIQTLVADSAQLPTCRHFRRLLVALPFCQDEQIITRVSDLVSSVMLTLEKRGPTLEYIRLQLLVSHSLQNIDTSSKADDTLASLVQYVLNLSTASARAECLSAIWAHLNRLNLPKHEALQSDLLKELTTTFEVILLDSASQFIATRVIVQSLARGGVGIACQFAQRLNTERRRDQAIATALEAASGTTDSIIDLTDFRSAFNMIADRRTKAKAIATVLANLVKAVESGGCTLVNLTCLLEETKVIDNAATRAAAFASIRLLLENDARVGVEELKSAVEDWLFDAWKSIDRLWDRIRSGYEIVAVVGQRLKTLATRYLENTDSLKQESSILAPETAWAAISSIRLVTAALAGLMQKRIIRDEDAKRLKRLIDAVPSFGEQALLWADVAQRLIIHNDPEYASKVVREHINPLLNLIPAGDRGFKDFIWVLAPQVFWTANPVATREYIATLPRQQRDEAYANLSHFLLRREPLFEPVSMTKKGNLRGDYSTLLQVIEFMKLIEDDSALATLIESIVDAIEESHSQITREQNIDVSRRLDALVSSKLPCKHGIQHHGYSIYCNANIGRLKKAYNVESLIEHAHTIPNITDRCFVTVKLASHLPTKQHAICKQLLSQALADSRSLSSCFDRVQMLTSLCRAYERVDKQECKAILCDAMKMTFDETGDHVARLQRHLVDLAHNVDPELAQDILGSLDNDPARIRAQTALKQELEVLSATRNITKHSASAKREPSERLQQKKGFRVTAERASKDNVSVDILPDIAWRSLAQLNGGTGMAYSLSELKNYFKMAAELPLSSAFPVLNWTVSCVAKLYGDKEQATTTIRTLCEATIASANLCLGLIARCTSSSVIMKDAFSVNSPLESGLIPPGDSSSGHVIIRKWMSTSIGERLFVIDPYFNLDDLVIVKYVLEERKECVVTILTDLSRFQEASPSECFNEHWNKLCAVSPPITDVVLMATTTSHIFPIHDRWIVSESSGLRIGTSFNGLGARRASEISEFGQEKAQEILGLIQPYLTRSVRVHVGERLEFVSFSLK